MNLPPEVAAFLNSIDFNKIKIKEQEKEKGRNSKSKDRNRHRSRSKDRHRSRSRSKDRHRSRSRSKDRNRHRSRSKSKDRSRYQSRSKDRNRHRSRSRSRSREKKYHKYDDRKEDILAVKLENTSETKNTDPTIITDSSRFGWLRHIYNNSEQLLGMLKENGIVSITHECSGSSPLLYEIDYMDIKNLSTLYKLMSDNKFSAVPLCEQCIYGNGYNKLGFPLCNKCRLCIFGKGCGYVYAGCNNKVFMTSLTHTIRDICTPCYNFMVEHM